MSLQILYEDNHLLVVNKPAGIATMGSSSGPTMHSLAAEYLKRKYNKPGNAYVGIVSRLDTMTSGTLVMARTSKAAARLQTQFAGKGADETAKVYLAIVEGRWESELGFLEDLVWKDDQAHRMRVTRDQKPNAKQATSESLLLASNDECSLLAVRLVTGRKHQIRLQCSDRGHPVWGDRKYGGKKTMQTGIALHSWKLRIAHPTLKQSTWYASPLPKRWNGLLSSLDVRVDDSMWNHVKQRMQIRP